MGTQQTIEAVSRSDKCSCVEVMSNGFAMRGLTYLTIKAIDIIIIYRRTRHAGVCWVGFVPQAMILCLPHRKIDLHFVCVLCHTGSSSLKQEKVGWGQLLQTVLHNSQPGIVLFFVILATAAAVLVGEQLLFFRLGSNISMEILINMFYVHQIHFI